VDEQLIVRYLLGDLSEQDAELLDELSIADDEFAGRLRAAENDLVDAYVRGELSGDSLRRFETSYLATPQRRQKVEFAGALHAYGRRNVAAAAGVRFTTPASRLVPATAATKGRSASGILRRWALAAAAVLAIAVATYLFMENRRLREEVTETRAARAEVEQTAQGLRTELQQERSASAAIRDELTRLRESLPSIKVPSLRPFVLLPMRRGAGQIATVALPRGIQEVPFLLRLESDDFPSYEAALRDPARGEAVWTSGPLSARSIGSNRSVGLQVPAVLLKPQNYTLELSGRPPGGPAELVTSYAFHVLLE
jgi:hypothetical protein